MSILGALWLIVAGIVAVPGTWVAARPLGDPTRRYSPLWLPAMVVVELAPFWLVVHAAAFAIGVVMGGLENVVGVVGAGLLALSAGLVLLVRVRTLLGVRRLRRHVDGRVHRARGWARLIGRPIPMPPGVAEVHGLDWRVGLTLDLVHPTSHAGDLPVMVYVHGGGWTGGDPQRQARDMYHALALAGWAVVAIRYPFAPHATVEAQIDTVRAAVRWVRNDLPTLGITATDVVVAGGSAGALLAAMVALSPGDDEHGVSACVGLYGVYDMANRNRTRAHWGKVEHVVMQCSYDDAPERYHAVSPLDHVHADAPPFLIVHGSHDTLVPVGEATQFVDVLERAGGAVTYVEVGGAQHAWDALSGVTSRTTAALIRDWLASRS